MMIIKAASIKFQAHCAFAGQPVLQICTNRRASGVLNYLRPGVFKSETMGPPLRQSVEKAPPSPAQFLDANGIMMMLDDPIDTQQLRQDSLI